MKLGVKEYAICDEKTGYNRQAGLFFSAVPESEKKRKEPTVLLSNLFFIFFEDVKTACQHWPATAKPRREFMPFPTGNKECPVCRVV